MVLAPGKIGAVIRVLVVGRVLLALGEVAAALVVHAAVARMLTLGEVPAVVLLGVSPSTSWPVANPPCSSWPTWSSWSW